MNAHVASGRLAGLIYLIVVVTGLFSLAYVPSQINVADDPIATLANIRASEGLFRAGIAAFLLKQVAFLLLPLALYPLLRPSGPALAASMVALAAASVPVAMVSLGGRLDALSLLTDPVLAATLSPDALQNGALLALREYRNGLLVTSLFWGLWVLPLGALVLASGRLPRLLGVFLLLGGAGYCIDVFGRVLLANYADGALASYVLMPAAIGEIGTCLWLLILGMRPARARMAS